MVLARVRRTVAERHLLERGERVLVACSGGPDSTVLLHVLHRLRRELGVELEVASVDHGLRPESVAEVAAVGRFAQRLGLPFHALRVVVEGPGSIQGTARDARYGALLACARSRGAAKVAVGHTRDDQAETVLGRLLRGAGIRGLGGVEPLRADGVVRPLIDCGRAEVRAHLARFDLPALEDPSNRDPRFERVRLREAVLPALRLEDPRIVEHLVDLADEARALEAWAEAQAATHAEGLRGRLQASVDAFEGLPRPIRRRVLRAWVEACIGARLGRAHLEALDRLVRRPGEVRLPGGWRAYRVGGPVVALRRPRPDDA